jgi:hypothetical protein
VLLDDEEVAVRGVESFIAHVLASGENEDSETALGGWGAGTAEVVQALDEIPVVEIEGVPAELVGDLEEGCGLGGKGLCYAFVGHEVGVCCRGQDAVEPCLQILVTWSCEGGAGEFFSVEAIGRLLGRVGAYWEGPGNGFRPDFINLILGVVLENVLVVRLEAILVSIFLWCFEWCDRHFGGFEFTELRQ